MLVIIGIYTFGLIYSIHKYEEIIKQYKKNLNEAQFQANFYRDAYDTEHKAIQVELDNNNALKIQIKTMQDELGYFRNTAVIQYESSTYKGSLWETPIYKDTEKLIEL